MHEASHHPPSLSHDVGNIGYSIGCAGMLDIAQATSRMSDSASSNAPLLRPVATLVSFALSLVSLVWLPGTESALWRRCLWRGVPACCRDQNTWDGATALRQVVLDIDQC